MMSSISFGVILSYDLLKALKVDSLLDLMVFNL